jgi:hypothetical protein
LATTVFNVFFRRSWEKEWSLLLGHFLVILVISQCVLAL